MIQNPNIKKRRTRKMGKLLLIKTIKTKKRTMMINKK